MDVCFENHTKALNAVCRLMLKQGVYIVEGVPCSVKLRLGISRPSVTFRRVWSYCTRLSVIRVYYFWLFSHAHAFKACGVVEG
jgi:hypothetical protein